MWNIKSETTYVTWNALAQVDHSVARSQRLGHLGRNLLDQERLRLAREESHHSGGGGGTKSATTG